MFVCSAQILEIAPVPVCGVENDSLARWISCSQLAAAGRVLLSRQLAAGTAGPELPSRRWPGPERGDGGRVRGGRE